MDPTSVAVCPKCHFPIQPVFYFCPNCGKKLKATALSTDLSKQIGIYLFCLLAPPFGIWYAVKYLLDKNNMARIVGLMALVITVISTIFAIQLFVSLFNTYENQFKQINQMNSTINQLNSLQGQQGGQNTQDIQELQNLGL